MRDAADAIAQIRNQCVQLWRADCIMRGPHRADARGYAEKPEDNLVPGCAALGLWNPISPLVLGPS